MLVKNGNAFIDGRFVRADVRIENGTITEIGEIEPRQIEGVYDAAGLYVLPGFVDIHIHAFAGADCMRGEADVRRMSDALIKTGVAAFVPTTMTAYEPETREALLGIGRVMERPQPCGARVLGAHMEGPFLEMAHKGAQPAACLQLPSVEAFDRMTEGCENVVRMLTLAPELHGGRTLIAQLKARGVVTCAAHTGASAEDIHEAADYGLSQITHLFNAQTPLHHRKPGVPGAGLSDPRLLVQVIADTIHVHPDVLRIAALCKGAAGMALISDSMEAAGMPNGDYALGEQKVLVREGVARLEDGTIAASTLLLHQAVSNMIHVCGFAPEMVIPMATSTPADSIGAKGFGRIEVGGAGVLALMDQGFNFAGALY